MKPDLSLLATLAVVPLVLLSACGRNPSFPTSAYQLTNREFLVGHTIEALDVLGRQSLATLELKSLKGTVTFLPDTPFEPAARPLAYKIEATSAPYSETATNAWQSPDAFIPADRVTDGIYDISFEFLLKDKDGFVLTELQSAAVMQTEKMPAGTTKSFQGVTTNAVSPFVASATRSIEVHATVVRGSAQVMPLNQ